jgi:Flp pilus assembly protein TadD
MLIPIDAVRSREGAAYLGGAAVVLAITLGILTDTVTDYLAQEAHVDSVRKFLADHPTARTMLLEAQDDVPSLLALASFELDRSDIDEQRLEAAESYFNRAFQLDPTNTAAIMGRVIVLLRRADTRSDPAARKAAAEEAGQLLTGVMDSSNPDVIYLQGAIDILTGDLPAAKQHLDDESRLATGPGMAARHWNRGVAAILAREGSALRAFMPGYLGRRWALPDMTKPDQAEKLAPRYAPAKMLTLAYRAALDPRAQPTGKEALSARCDSVIAALAPTHRSGVNRGPYQPSGLDTAAVRNALGLALIECGRFEDAVKELTTAAGAVPHELLYVRNLAQARYLYAESLTDPNERTAALRVAARDYQRLAAQLAKQEGREEQAVLTATNAAAVMIAAGNAGGAAMSIQSVQAAYPNPANFQRDLGAVLDHAGKAECVQHYREAIKLGHPQSRQLERRARTYGR